MTALERWEDAKAIEKLIEEFQERQNAFLQEQAATESAEGEAEELPELVEEAEELPEEEPAESAAESVPED